MKVTDVTTTFKYLEWKKEHLDPQSPANPSDYSNIKSVALRCMITTPFLKNVEELQMSQITEGLPSLYNIQQHYIVYNMSNH